MTTVTTATVMTDRLRELVADYLRVRRSLGYRLVDPERVLFAFVDYLKAVDARAVTVEHAVGFATADPDASPRTQALRLSAVRLFARWAHVLDPTMQVPPARLLPARSTRAAPYLYSEAEIAALLDVASRLRPAIRAASHHTLIALMAATGIRTGEALALDITDLDAQASMLTVRGKYGKTRLLPLHPSVRDGLTAYLRERRQILPAPSSPALLVNGRGLRLTVSMANYTFRALTRETGLTSVSSACRPRLHDLRHRFAVDTLLDAYRSGQDPAAVLPVLATWLGHTTPAETYWYLTGTAELLDAAAERLRAHETAGPQGGGRR